MALNRRAGCTKTGVLLRETLVFAFKVPKRSFSRLRAKMKSFSWLSADKQKNAGISALQGAQKQRVVRGRTGGNCELGGWLRVAYCSRFFSMRVLRFIMHGDCWGQKYGFQPPRRPMASKTSKCASRRMRALPPPALALPKTSTPLAVPSTSGVRRIGFRH